MGYECRTRRKPICKAQYYKRLFLSLIKKAKMLPVETSLRTSLRRLIIDLFSFKSCRFLLELRGRL
jgi:hypothetical protein